MQIRDVWVRFYKSFNFDYELKAHPNPRKEPWQDTGDGWLPHVRIPIEPDITAVVGANESGKTHLLDAISIILTGSELRQRDFCRYSTLFSVEKDKRLYPEVGATFELTEADAESLAEVEVPLMSNGNLLMLRPEPNVVDVVNEKSERFRLSDVQRAAVEARLPHAFPLDTHTDLPDAVSITSLAAPKDKPLSRKKRAALLSLVKGAKTADAASAVSAEVAAAAAAADKVDKDEQARQRLGQLLLTKVARIDESSFQELQLAIAEEREGLVNGLIQQMNRSIARHLNISKWWSQDEDFQLQVSPREHELVFTIRDRTGTDYSFSERSRGLTYFLSYYVQLRSHDRPTDRPEVLLMDEPDAYLSALGQQDLLRVLENHARPEDNDRADQVVYVTHSPFLINKNAGHRVRVVDKGTRDEGTRLVKDSTKNHYEPLRTSLGAAVAETAFIGGDNLFIEGIADQILLTGMNARALRAGTPPSQCLDLNQVTLVPGGSNVPYMLYLARGRDQYKPACAVLLDSDSTGKEAQQQIKKGGAKGRPTVPEELVVMIGDWSTESGAVAEPGVTICEPEDLIPVSLAGIAARRYARNFLGETPEDTEQLTDENIRAAFASEQTSLWDAIEIAFKAIFGTKIGKAGFAKELLAHLSTVRPDENDNLPEDVTTLDSNYKALLKRLADTLRNAREREDAARRDKRVDRVIDAFIDDHPTGSKRDAANMILTKIDGAADNTTFGDYIKVYTARLQREFGLDNAPLAQVEQYPEFLQELKNLPLQARLAEKGRLGESSDPVDAGGPGRPRKATSNAEPEMTSAAETGDPPETGETPAIVGQVSEPTAETAAAEQATASSPPPAPSSSPR